MSYMNKSKTGRTSQSGYHCMRQSIETGMSHGKSFVHGITGFKIFWIIISSIPWHIPLPRTLLIHVSDAAAFPAAKLLQRQSRYIFMREAQLIHLSYHIQMKPLVADSPGLFHQHSGTMSQGTAAGIIAHSMFPGPDNSDTGIPDQFHSPMGNVCPRAQNQYRDSSGWKINNAVFICYSNGSISSVDDCMVHIMKVIRSPICGSAFNFGCLMPGISVIEFHLRWSSFPAHRLYPVRFPRLVLPGTSPDP